MSTPTTPSAEALQIVQHIRTIVDLEREPHWAYRNTVTAKRTQIRHLLDELAAALKTEPKAQEHEAELQEAEIGALCYRGNTVSFMHDKARAYGDALTETWDVLKEFGHHCDGATRLKDKVREVLTAQQPPAEPKAQAQAAELVDVTIVLFPDGTNYWTDATAAGQVEAAWGYWKSTKRREQLEVYALVGATGGAVKLRMLREDYARIPATNTSAAIQKAAGEVKHD